VFVKRGGAEDIGGLLEGNIIFTFKNVGFIIETINTKAIEAP